MTTVLDALQKGTGYLEKQGVDGARLSMQHLLAHVMGCDRMQLYLDFDRPLEETELENLRELMRARARGMPLQHLLGKVEFHGAEFLCDERALIPRPETEQLVDFLVQRAWPEGVRILDMGCGSGVIGLSLAMALRHLEPEVVLVDRSAEALALARENAESLAEALEGARLRWVESDLFDRVDGTFHLVVANLPYVATREMEELSPEVRQDPAEALHGGETGRELVERFLEEAGAHGESGALFALEIGMGQASSLRKTAATLGWGDVEVKQDLEGQDRFLLVREPKVS